MAVSDLRQNALETAKIMALTKIQLVSMITGNDDPRPFIDTLNQPETMFISTKNYYHDKLSRH